LSEDSPVIYVGSFAKTLFPSMRLGFIVLPVNLADRAKLAINFTGQFAPLILQAALADFMEQGHFFLHLNRMRRLYGPRRRYFLKLCKDYLGEWLEPLDGRAGIQITAFLKNSADDQAIAGEALRRGVNLVPLSMYFRSLPPRSGFVMGYAGTPEATMEESFRTLREVFLQFA
jgi:GntR family transcriptional regulator/MocR family aminotransferase